VSAFNIDRTFFYTELRLDRPEPAAAQSGAADRPAAPSTSRSHAVKSERL